MPPKRWTPEELEADRLDAIEIFRRERREEPLELYVDALDSALRTAQEVLEATADLTRVRDQALWILTDPARLDFFRYLAGPPISIDDLKTLVDSNSVAPTRLRRDPELVEEVIGAVMDSLDPRRFPWVVERRQPTEAERGAAALATAALIAMQRAGTGRRHAGKEAQEGQVRESLVRYGLSEVDPAPINTLTEAPAPGSFCRECMFGDRKADFVVTAWDARVMPIECKVSNSALNSIKRLNNDAMVKAGEWLRAFGERQVVPAAVLSGVFKLAHLTAAQRNGLTLFWAHRLETLVEWLETTRPD